MAQVMTLGSASLGAETREGERCKCVYNPRTKKSAQLCFVGKSPKNRSGWRFMKGGSQRCSRR